MSYCKIRHSVRTFAEESMEVKLRRDDRTKNAWEKTPIDHLFLGLIAEVEELMDALAGHMENPTEENQAAAMLECGDVANYAMMIFSKIHPLTQNSIRGIRPRGGNTTKKD